MTALGLVDANAMVGPVPAGDIGNVTTAWMVEQMDRLGIDQALVFHGLARWHDPATGNRQVLSDVEAAERRLLPVAVALPPGTGEVGTASAFARGLRRDGMVAARVFPAEHGYGLAGADLRPLLDALAEHKLALLVDAEQTTWDEIAAAAAAQPALNLLVCGVGYRSLRRITGVLERCPKVLLDLSYLASHRGVEWLVERFGAGRLVFGTGSPLNDAGGAVTRLLLSELSAAEQHAVGVANLRHLLHGWDAM